MSDIPLRGKILFGSRPQNRILVLFRGFFTQFPMITSVMFIWECPLPRMLQAYREAPHPETGTVPYELLMS